MEGVVAVVGVSTAVSEGGEAECVLLCSLCEWQLQRKNAIIGSSTFMFIHNEPHQKCIIIRFAVPQILSYCI